MDKNGDVQNELAPAGFGPQKQARNSHYHVSEIKGEVLKFVFIAEPVIFGIGIFEVHVIAQGVLQFLKVPAPHHHIRYPPAASRFKNKIIDMIQTHQYHDRAGRAVQDGPPKKYRFTGRSQYH
ncbi:hypothetical protein BMS3Abin09_00114 [bacterium BMS3Abin09]|nr:hypothetical protein BMS3Abin09_00114 [bacterium BMS3Abin09]